MDYPDTIDLLPVLEPTSADRVMRGWWVLGWQAKLRWDPLAGLYEATILGLPGVRGTGSGRGEALAELSAQVAREVGMSPATCDQVN